MLVYVFFFSSRRRHTRCALVTGVQTCALPIFADDHVEVLDVEFELFARACDQHVLLLERLDQRQHAADVFDGGIARGFVIGVGIQHQADAVARVQLAQQRAVVMADEVNALDAALGRGQGGLQIADRKSVVEGKSVSVRVDLGGRRIIKKKKDKKKKPK